jgi:hypothetical protein
MVLARGKWVWLNVWGTACSGCLVEIAVLSDLRTNHSAGVRVLGVAINGGRNTEETSDTASALLSFAGGTFDDSFAGNSTSTWYQRMWSFLPREHWLCRHGNMPPERSLGNDRTWLGVQAFSCARSSVQSKEAKPLPSSRTQTKVSFVALLDESLQLLWPSLALSWCASGREPLLGGGRSWQIMQCRSK